MKKTEAMKIIIDELNRHTSSAVQMHDGRMRLGRAVRLLEDWVKWDEARLEGIIDETIEEFEKKENDYAEEKQ